MQNFALFEIFFRMMLANIVQFNAVMHLLIAELYEWLL